MLSSVTLGPPRRKVVLATSTAFEVSMMTRPAVVDVIGFFFCFQMKIYNKMQVVASFGKLYNIVWQSLVPLAVKNASESSLPLASE